MQVQQLLLNVWGVWISFSSGNKNQAEYGSNLEKLYDIQNLSQLAYAWLQSDLSNPNMYFTNPKSFEYTKYEIGGVMRKIQSVNFFKNPIQPTWEYGDNPQGGYFNFSLPFQETTENVNKIFEVLVFMALGEDTQIAKSLKGIRIVDTASKQKFRCRFEIWVNYKESEENLEKIKKDSYEIKEVLERQNIKLDRINFFNIGSKKSTTVIKNQQDAK